MRHRAGAAAAAAFCLALALLPAMGAATAREVFLLRLAFAPDGRTLAALAEETAAGRWATRVIRWEARSGRLVGAARVPGQHQGGAALSTDLKLLALAEKDDRVTLWDAVGGRPMRAVELPAGNSWTGPVLFAPDGKSLAIALAESHTVVQYAATSGRLMNQFGPAGALSSLAFTPDGRLLATAGELEGGGVDLWAVASARRQQRFPAAGIRHEVVISPDGRLVAGGGEAGAAGDQRFGVWETDSGAAVASWAARDVRLRSLTFSPDGRALAWGRETGPEENQVELRDARSGQLLRTCTAPGLLGESLAFSPDGARLACDTVEGTVLLLHGKTGKLLRTLAVPEARR